MMNCSQVEIDLMNGNLNKEITEHLEKCGDCQIFKDSLDSFLPAKPASNAFSPQIDLDFVIKKEADLFMEEQMRAFNHHQPKHIHRPKRMISYLASAACGVLIAWLVVLVLESTQHRRVIGGSMDRNFANSASSNELSWSNISMDDEFLEVITDIELNILLLPNEEESVQIEKE